MYHLHAGHMSRPPSPAPRTPRSHHQSLALRTTTAPGQVMSQRTPSSSQTMSQSTPSSTPPDQPYPTYPLPIPESKIKAALKCYTKLQLEKALEQHLREANSTGDPLHLSARGPPTTYSGISRLSSQAPSVATSAYEGNTELSSLMSFGEEETESPSSVRAKALEAVSHDGKKVKKHVRKRYTPVRKAKTALKRCLGSCWVCKKRKVPCPEEHHDIEVLEQLYQNAQRVRSQASHTSDSSQRTARSPSGSQHVATGDRQADFLHMGQNEELLQPYGAVASTQLELLSPGGGPPDLLEDVPTPQPTLYRDTPTLSIPVPNSYHSTPTLSAPAQDNYHTASIDLNMPDPDPYSTYEDGAMLALGLRLPSGYLHCQHLGICSELFQSPGALEQHWEDRHVAFTRIRPSHRYHCSEPDCYALNRTSVGACSRCNRMGTIQLWIYGHFIRPQTYHTAPPDDQDLRRYNEANAYYPTSFGLAHLTLGNQWNTDMGGGGNYNTDNQPYTDHGSDDSTYHGPSGQAYNYGPFNEAGGGGLGYQGYQFRGFRQMAQKSPSFLRLGCTKAMQACRRHPLIVLSLMLMLLTALGFTHDFLLEQARKAFPKIAAEFRQHLPVVGFMGILASFAISHTMQSTTEDPDEPPEARTHSSPPPERFLRSGPYPLQGLAAASQKYAQAMSQLHVRSNGFT